MASVVITGDTSGSITLSAPAVAGSNTLSLPANTGTIITTASSGQSIPKAALPTGSVLQVVQGTYNVAVSTTGQTYIDTGLTASITPTSSSSKILVLVTQQGYTTTDNTLQIRIVRGSTTIVECLWAVTFASGTVMMSTIALSVLDSPATTSSTTYKTTFRSRDAGEEVGVNREGNAPAYITLLEIAA